MSFEKGHLYVGSWNGAPIRIHWTASLGALVFGGFQFAPGAWLGFVAVVLVHELGHAVMVRASGHSVVGIEVGAFGGECLWEGWGTHFECGLIAWGGVIGQLVLFALTLSAIALDAPIVSAADSHLVQALTVSNLLIVPVNLLPIPPLDGAEAWPLVGLLAKRAMRRVRRWHRRARTRAAQRAWERADRLAEAGTVEEKIEGQLAAILRDAKNNDSNHSDESTTCPDTSRPSGGGESQ